MCEYVFVCVLYWFIISTCVRESIYVRVLSPYNECVFVCLYVSIELC